MRWLLDLPAPYDFPLMQMSSLLHQQAWRALHLHTSCHITYFRFCMMRLTTTFKHRRFTILSAGEQADFTVVAKDGKGVRKSLGGDTFALSWTRAGAGEAPHSGRVRIKTTGTSSIRINTNYCSN